VPGPAGENAYSFTTAPFIQPLVGFNVIATVTHDGWMVPGQVIFVQGGGYYQVVSVSGLSVTLNNLGTTGNAAPGTTVPNASKVAPGGTGGSSGAAFTTTSANFVQPAVSANQTAQVINTGWMAVGEVLFIATGGYYQIFSITDGTHVVVTNLGYPGNAAPGVTVNSPQQVTPGGLRGPTGATGIATLNGISPTTTKGDLIVDNGANNPLASDVRLGVGTDGQVLAANAGQPTGLAWTTVLPNAVATVGDIPVFNATTGKPCGLSDSKLLITSDGALQSTPTGGNARGSKAVDLQVDRIAVTQVASGANSVIAGGKQNTASGADSAVLAGEINVASNTDSGVCCGSSNTASGVNAFVGGGKNNTASGQSSGITAGQANAASANFTAVGGGTGNTASGVSATIAGGQANIAGGDQSSVVGGNGASSPLFGEVAHASGPFSATGDAQECELLWRIATTDATAGVQMWLDGAGASQQAVLPLGATWLFDIRMVGRSSAGVSAGWQVTGAIQNVAGTVTLTAAVVTTMLADGTGGTWGVVGSFAVTADNVNKCLKLAVTGAAATNIRWVAHARIVQVIF